MSSGFLKANLFPGEAILSVSNSETLLRSWSLEMCVFVILVRVIALSGDVDVAECVCW